MTIEYALTRIEIIQGFFQSLRSSPKYLSTILLYSLGMSGIALISTGAFSRAFAFSDVFTALAGAVGFMILLPLILFIRGKTSTRSVTISSEGISTTIGSLKGQIPWRKIKVISETDRYVLIAGANGNAFFVPSRAFSDAEHKALFLAEIKNWANTAT